MSLFPALRHERPLKRVKKTGRILLHCNSMVFKKRYLLLALFLLLVEILIALFVRDRFLRPYGGDFLVVIFLYCLGRGLLDKPPAWMAVAVLLFAFLIEFSQYLGLVSWLGLEDNTLARVVLGNKFSWEDLVAYTLGCLTAYGLDRGWRGG